MRTQKMRDIDKLFYTEMTTRWLENIAKYERVGLTSEPTLRQVQNWNGLLRSLSEFDVDCFDDLLRACYEQGADDNY